MEASMASASSVVQDAENNQVSDDSDAKLDRIFTEISKYSVSEQT